MSMWTRMQPAYAANMWNEALNMRLGTEVIVPFLKFIFLRTIVIIVLLPENSILAHVFLLSLILTRTQDKCKISFFFDVRKQMHLLSFFL